MIGPRPTDCYPEGRSRRQFRRGRFLLRGSLLVERALFVVLAFAAFHWASGELFLWALPGMKRSVAVVVLFLAPVVAAVTLRRAKR